MDPSRATRRVPIAVVAGIFLLALAAAASADRGFATEASHAPRLVRSVAQFVTGFGRSGYMFLLSGLIAALAILALRRGIRVVRGWSTRAVAERAIFFFAAIAASGIAAQTIKHLIGRPRPRLLTTSGPFGFAGPSISDVTASFPSGHTTSAFAAAVALGFMMPRWRRPLLGLAALIGLSRVLVGAHYPSDVVAGAALGSVVTLLLARAFARRHVAFRPSGGRAVIEPLRPAGAVPARARP